MLESLLDRYGLDESITFRMGKGFVNIVERQFLPLLPVVMMDCLQTGDITQEGGSCQTAEDDHGMPSLEFFPKGSCCRSAKHDLMEGSYLTEVYLYLIIGANAQVM